MSEYQSLYVRVPIKLEQLQQFFAEKPKPVPLSKEWLDWWETREMHSKFALKEIATYPISSNREIVDYFLGEAGTGAREFYDETRKEWVFVVVFYAENYSALLPMFGLLHGFAPYLTANESGIAIVYDFYWGSDDVMACLEFHNQKVAVRKYNKLAEIPAPVSGQITQTLEETVEILSNQN